MIEIERKFLVSSDAYKNQAEQSYQIIQGFLNTHPERTVRVRISGEEAFLTVKGKSNETGTTRFEWEQQISIKDAKKLLELCEEGIIRKTRHIVFFKSQRFEVDEFYELNKGLVLAELELKKENEYFAKPDWLGEEVTGDPKYYNSQLIQHPYNTWNL